MEGSRGIARIRARFAQETDFCPDTTCDAAASSTTLSRARTTDAAICKASALRGRIVAIEEHTLGTPVSAPERGRITRRSKRTLFIQSMASSRLARPRHHVTLSRCAIPSKCLFTAPTAHCGLTFANCPSKQSAN